MRFSVAHIFLGLALVFYVGFCVLFIQVGVASHGARIILADYFGEDFGQ